MEQFARSFVDVHKTNVHYEEVLPGEGARGRRQDAEDLRDVVVLKNLKTNQKGILVTRTRRRDKVDQLF